MAKIPDYCEYDECFIQHLKEMTQYLNEIDIAMGEYENKLDKINKIK